MCWPKAKEDRAKEIAMRRKRLARLAQKTPCHAAEPAFPSQQLLMQLGCREI